MGVVRLPKVPMSKGVSSVSAMTMRTDANGTRSSSATDCVRDVRAFWPTSAFPVKAVTVPSSPMCSQEAISLGSSRRLDARAGRGFLEAGGVRCDGENGDTSAEDFEEIAAGKLKLMK